MRNLASLSILFAALFVGASAFSMFLVEHNNRVSHSNTLLYASRKSPGNIQRPENEFSRTYRVESVLGSKQRDYQASIDASDDELVELAKRFDLSNIEKLQAESRHEKRTRNQGNVKSRYEQRVWWHFVCVCVV